MQLKIILKQKEGVSSFKKRKPNSCLFIAFRAEQKKYYKDIIIRIEQHTTKAHKNQHTCRESIYLGASAAGMAQF